MDWKPEKDTDRGKIVCEYGLSTSVLPLVVAVLPKWLFLCEEVNGS